MHSPSPSHSTPRAAEKLNDGAGMGGLADVGRWPPPRFQCVLPMLSTTRNEELSTTRELGAWIHFLSDPFRFLWCLLDHEEGLVVFDHGLDVVELMSAEHDEVI